ncbi:hypothetical protein [Corynebacterium freiburgense]|uniref:hypothetical protein n=1 Tax=Corynebacterium freiburgense TaxID=556548 RepID=UPI0003FC2620|nr:hypothetical protein [Corynebacterium freiburgense]WJZ03798.1 hypothetical protein CFREI_12705 [Corynebacterium freiburgense]
MGPDSAFHRALEKFSDVAVVAAIMVACCLVVVPGGRAIRSSYRVWLLDSPHPIRTFIRGLREPGGAVSWWWGFTLVIHILALIEWLAIDHFAVRSGILSGILMVYAISAWYVPLASCAGTGVVETFRSSVGLSIRHPIRTCGVLITAIVVWVLILALIPHSLFFGFLIIGIGQYLAASFVTPLLGCNLLGGK